MRIALVHVADSGGGAERSVLTLHQSLLSQGHDCRLFVGTKHLDTPQVFEIPQDRTIPGLLRITRPIERKGIQNLYAPWFRKLPELIGDVDVVHLHSLWKARNGFADLQGVRAIASRYSTVMTLRESWMMTGHCACPIACERWQIGCGKCPDLNRVPGIEKDFTHFNWKRKRTTIQRSDLQVTAISRWLSQQIQKSPIFRDKRVHVVHNSVDAAAFRPGDQREARQTLGLPSDQFIVMLAGQSIEFFSQGISQRAVHALNQLGDHTIHTMLVGKSAPEVAKTLLTPSTAVPFRETQEEMATCFQAADLTIVPSEYETFGRVAAESLFCGTPVVAFATGGLPEIVADKICGRLVPSGDVSAMAEVIAELKANPDVLTQYRAQCVKHARRRFNTDKIADEYTDVYRQVIDERERSASNSHSDRHRSVLSRIDSTDTATISCIIPAFNSEVWLERAVHSIVDTGYESLDVVIVEDGSSDGTLLVAKDLAKRYPANVRVVQHPGGINRGVSASRNLGLRHANGDWISLLDADDYVYPNRYRSAVEILSNHPEIDGVHQVAEMVFPTEEAKSTWWKDSQYFGFQNIIQPDDLLDRLLSGQCWATSAIVFRRTLLERTGVFHEGLRIAEDCHLWFRMATLGKLVSGDLIKPVSAYWRRTDSVYQPSSSQRLQMIQSMSMFLSWMRSAGIERQVQARAKRAVRQYITRGLINARFEGERALAWSLAKQGLGRMPSLLFERSFCGQVARLAMGR